MAQWWPLGWSSNTCKYSVMATPVYIAPKGKSGGRHPLAWTPTASIQDAQLLLLFTPYHISGNSPRCPHLSPPQELWNISELLKSVLSLLDNWCCYPVSFQDDFFFFCHARWDTDRIQLLFLFFPLTCCLTFAGYGIWKSNMPSTLKRLNSRNNNYCIIIIIIKINK